MATGPRYRVDFRRKREMKTNYRRRLKLLLSEQPRITIRLSSNNVTAQVLSYSLAGDVTNAASNSKQLKAYGWKANNSNLGAAYLTGFLLGKKALEKEIKTGVLDLGLVSPKRGTKIYAVLKGMVDAGMEIPHDPAIMPAEERIKGVHISEYAKSLGKDKEKIFSGYKKEKLDPVAMPDHFEEVLARIRGD